VGRYDLKLSEIEFWALTPDEFNLLCQRHNQYLERMDGHVALICAVIANCFRDPKKKPFKVEDFMPKVSKAQTPEEMLNTLKNYQAMFEVYNGK